ncbi:uncharacterized protein B0T15DRAFT_534316 [Chaetomium strumarium]|uniref:Calcineurin-like phosphoesterase domain-containing protein n=1 Tax=Chaetomium strumarium TaxID=1170767 RepID=A0AAJ0M234_9PEZI|nr:hypothetical protein B0T15DRAFT_534316 [Chaetomium strumarium]
MPPSAFQILSDLHLETYTSYDFHFKQTAPNLALLGDIGHVGNDALFTFLEAQLRRYWNVFFVLGNHEPIMGSWPAAKRRVRDFADRMEQLRARSTIGRFVFLDQTRHDINDSLTVIGCTLFSRVTQEQAAAVGSRFVDFQQIQRWTVADHVDAHLSDLGWLNAQVAEIESTQPQRRIAIFTHYSPTLDARAVAGRHRNSAVTSCFATDLSGEECWTSPLVVMWAFGHTHFSCEFTDAFGKKVVSNQRGYAFGPQNAFDSGKVFIIGEEADGGMTILCDLHGEM